jgi:hypothetical protein
VCCGAGELIDRRLARTHAQRKHTVQQRTRKAHNEIYRKKEKNLSGSLLERFFLFSIVKLRGEKRKKSANSSFLWCVTQFQDKAICDWFISI